MSSTQKKNKKLVDELVQLTIELGITNETLRPHVVSAYRYTMGSPLGLLGDVMMHEAERKASEISSAGRTAQLHFLLGQWGPARLRKELHEMGSFLDGFVHRMDSDPKQLRADIGEDNVTRNGDVR
ncbi:MAG: hypothetical protein GWN39_13525 [Thermoplasmata archaeon]|nr:hypothetical protein [Thermoplasmata archaeon]NIT78438.1 hypothetical protein [Thermoplasmata archaeon]NIU50037.1 hypothetical protein [Thermoplasmata archaeon]NIV79728.1 hypothetical protein [Thermoplasmata archaeon]NIY04807.1 hypothetical protein [Thermoplasmata archaeon]